MTDINRRIAALPPEKRAALEAWLLGKRASRPADEPIPARGIHGPAPLSFPQQRLWFLSRLHPDSRAYNEASALRLGGPLKPAALRLALNEVVRRHESLRTTFALVDGEPMQRVAPSLTVPISVTDLSCSSPGDCEAEARKFAAAEAARPFDLSKGPLVRAALARLTKEDHVFVLVMHHIITDGWSMEVFYRELSALYQAFSAGKPSPLPGLPLQYPDYALWQRESASGDSFAGQLAYWEGKLAGVPMLELHTDRPRPPAQTFGGRRLSFAIDPDAARALDELARREGATRFMTFAAVWSALLYRYTGQTDVAVGTPTSGRGRAELEGLIGFFANTVVLRTDLSGDPSFVELLRRERETALSAYDNQDVPFDKIVERLQPRRDLSRPPLFQVMFAMYGAVEPEFAGLAVERFDLEPGAAKFDLSLLVHERAHGLTGVIEYNTDLFADDTIRRMAGHLNRMLSGFAAEPSRPVSRIPLLTDAERRMMLVDWNDTATDYPRDKCVHEVFEAHAARTPDAVAVVLGERSLTYRELDSRANRLANRLRSIFTGPDVLVGLFVERSIDMVVAMLAIFKAGGAYVPIDPEYPLERVRFVLDDTEVPVILTQESLVARVAPCAARLIRLDADWPDIENESDAPGASGAGPDSLAYCIYTSGSTGRPKGVLIRHKGVNRLVIDTNYVSIEPSDRVTQVANICFDVSTFEIWAPLLNGGRLVIVPREVLLSPAAFERETRAQGVTVMDLSTAVLNQYVDDVPGAFAGLRYLVFGGEAADPASLRKLIAMENPPRHIVNAYGPTEITDIASWYEVREIAPGARSIPIGLPISNTTLYILDPHLEPVPVGVSGELYVGGDGVARGYLKRDDLTAERFVPDPFSADLAARLYRTGDAARFLPDGNIEFLGRLDRQVKLRGFRVELGEIEAILGSHPSVKDAAVLCREDAPGDKRIVAYVSTKDAAAPSAEDMRSFLARSLPDYMLPSAFVKLDAMPLTPNGKVDRAALPAPDDADTGSYAPPRTPVEEALARIWAVCLGRERVGIRDSFFDLGGHSLLAVRLFASIEKVFGKALPLVTLFEAPTVEKLAKVVGGTGRAGVFPPLVAIEKGNGGVPLFCVATADAFLYADLARRLGPEQPVYGLHPQGIIPREHPVIDIKTLAARYVDEALKVHPEGPYLLCGMCAGGIVAWEMAQILHDQGRHVPALLLFDTPAPLGVMGRYAVRLRRMGRAADHAWHHLAALMRLEPGMRMGYLKARLGRGKGRASRTGAAASHEVPVEQAYWMAYNGAYTQSMSTYIPSPYAGRVAIFMSEEAGAWKFAEGRLKWRDLAPGGADVHVIPGTHDGMLHEPYVESVAALLKTYVDDAHGASDQ